MLCACEFVSKSCVCVCVTMSCACVFVSKSCVCVTLLSVCDNLSVYVCVKELCDVCGVTMLCVT